MGCGRGTISWVVLLLYSEAFVQGWRNSHSSDHASNYVDNGDDLLNFVSRPDLRPPKFDIKVHNRNKVAPGYWFVAPYTDLTFHTSTRLYRPAQIGPHIYDGNGELVWSGAHLFEHSITFDFKTGIYRNSPALTFILRPDRFRRENSEGGGVILDNTFKKQDILLQASGSHAPNMHEFTITEQSTALMISVEIESVEKSVNPGDDWLNFNDQPVRIANNGFREMDIESGYYNFEWWALKHIDPHKSSKAIPQSSGYSAKPWDWFHLNSIDKNQDGDYLISARFTNTIYKISGQNGSIIWQLGGHNSSFKLLNGFNFSSQHDARYRFENSSHTIISFLDNAANNFANTSTTSSAVMVSLDLRSMTATCIMALERPDKGLSRLRGNVQVLPNGNSFVCWSENSLISEFDRRGNLLLEASFASDRFVTYRAYKLNFTAYPEESIALKAIISSTEEARDGGMTTFYTSWNGATQVASWRFYSRPLGKHYSLIGEATKTGFETQFIATGIHCEAYVEAISTDGIVLGKSPPQHSALPQSWKDHDCAKFHRGSDNNSSKITKVHTLLGAFTAASAQAQRFLSFCTIVLLILLSLAIWRIQQLNLKLKNRLKYEYTLLDQG